MAIGGAREPTRAGVSWRGVPQMSKRHHSVVATLCVMPLGTPDALSAVGGAPRLRRHGPAGAARAPQAWEGLAHLRVDPAIGFLRDIFIQEMRIVFNDGVEFIVEHHGRRIEIAAGGANPFRRPDGAHNVWMPMLARVGIDDPLGGVPEAMHAIGGPEHRGEDEGGREGRGRDQERMPGL